MCAWWQFNTFYVSPSSTVTTYELYTEYACVHVGNSILFLCLPKL